MPTTIADRLLDSSVVLSFDRNGFRRHARRFDPADLDVDLTGRVCLVTGANSGIGLATSRALAALGADVVMLCRSVEKGERARAEVEQATGRAPRVVWLDVADLGSVATLRERLPVDRVDVLVHNAGILPDARRLTADGLESTLATNLVGPFRLTCELLPLLERGREAEPARIVWVSSGGMLTRKLSVDRLPNTEGRFDGVTAYADTKRAMVVFSELLAERLAGRGVVVNSMHPGWATTPGVSSQLPRFHRLTSAILRTPEEGADTVVWLAACRRIGQETGRFWFDREVVSTHPIPGTQASETERARLWDAVVAWSGVDPVKVP